MPSFKPVIALTRGLEILRVVNEQQLTSVGALHKATGLDKATIVRMLETLEHEGYVMRDAERARGDAGRVCSASSLFFLLFPVSILKATALIERCHTLLN